MDIATYVVCLVGAEDVSPFKVFAARADAIAFAEQAMREGLAIRTLIYRVPNVSNVRVAVEAVETGNAELTDIRGDRLSEEELKRTDERDFEHAKSSPEAMLKYLGLY
jgi:hypothetical protein